jgi:hypothetical protein
MCKGATAVNVTMPKRALPDTINQAPSSKINDPMFGRDKHRRGKVPFPRPFRSH